MSVKFRAGVQRSVSVAFASKKSGQTKSGQKVFPRKKVVKKHKSGQKANKWFSWFFKCLRSFPIVFNTVFERFGTYFKLLSSLQPHNKFPGWPYVGLVKPDHSAFEVLADTNPGRGV